MTAIGRPLRIAALIKQIPRFEEMTLGADGRLVRSGDVEMNPYCRRAVSMGVSLARESAGTCTAFSMGPPSAEDVLREAIAWGADDGVLISDPAFAGSDTLATATVLAAGLGCEQPFDVVLVGRNSVDGDTGQVGPQLAELLGVAFLGAARTLVVSDGVVAARLEHDDGWAEVRANLPAVVACAERLCDPCKVDPDGRAAVPADRIRHVVAADLGPGPWGQEASPTRVGQIRTLGHTRAGRRLTGSLDEQVDELAALLVSGRASSVAAEGALDVPITQRSSGPSPVAVVVEPQRRGVAIELLGAAADLAASSGRSVTAIVPGMVVDLDELGGRGADHVVLVDGTGTAADVSASVADWCENHRPRAVLVPSTMWGRELAARLAVRIGAGLIGDAVNLELVDGRVIGWKPAFGGQLVAAIRSVSDIQLFTVRPGVLPRRTPRRVASPTIESLPAERRGLIEVLASGRDDDVDILASASVVVGIGMGVERDRYSVVEEFADAIGGTLAATRKVTDRGWLPRARQIGITGVSIAPDVYVAVGVSGRFNHLVGVRGAKTVVAINVDPDAPIFGASDLGIVGDWSEVVPRLTAAIVERRCDG